MNNNMNFNKDKENTDPMVMRDAYLVEKPRQTNMDRPIRCYSLTLEREEHPTKHSSCFMT
jgi:hypothetical protein